MGVPIPDQADDPRVNPDRVGIALGSLAAGATIGAAVVTVALAGLRDALATALPNVVFLGIITSAAIGWRLAGPLRDGWRQGLTAALAVGGGLMLAGVTAPIDLVAGRPGLVIYAIVLAMAAVLALRARRRALGS
ncbi:MAG TPA: hypothetical protein VGA37_06500 [Gemmatimonadales bacterium]